MTRTVKQRFGWVDCTVDTSGYQASPTKSYISVSIELLNRIQLGDPGAWISVSVACDRRGNSLHGEQIGEADLQVPADQHSAAGRNVLEAILGFAVASGDQQHAPERVVTLAAFTGDRQPPQA